MQKKLGKWYADWRDEKGRRHRKAFPSRGGALRHQHKMAKDARAKKALASGPSGSSPRRGNRASARHVRKETLHFSLRKNSRKSRRTS
jgi:hypothetical protein